MVSPDYPQKFPVVGIGASAGGLKAFKKLLTAIPEKSGMAYVLIQHLAPSHESVLPELLSRVTKIPIHEITDNIDLAPDNIYIIPENKIVIASDGVLKLTNRDQSLHPNLPIDIFFISLANVHKSFAIGVILSGTAFDGTEGLKSIKENGGVTIAQDLDSAQFTAMPLSAINADAADFILPPEVIPQLLLKIKESYQATHAYVEDDEVPKDDVDLYRQITTIIRTRTGNDFSNYKQATIRRRIARRLAATDTADLASYVNYLRHNKDEQEALFNDLLIPVTYFFRDNKTFEELSNSVFPDILKNKKGSEPLRIWVAGCATGEEAYSLAICLHEFFESKKVPFKIQVFASDISHNTINKARNGIYTKQDVKNISAARLQQYFIKTSSGYQVAAAIREMCVFAVHNFLKDPPFAKMDLISCRNVFIYMDVLFQKKALTTFHYALNNHGILLLGKSESISTSQDLFSIYNKQHKMYVRKTGPGSFMRVNLVRADEEVFTTQNTFVTKRENKNDFLKAAEGILFTRFTPSAIIVNEHMDIVHFHGDLSLILMPPQGKPSLNVLKMARNELVFELRNSFHQAKKAKSNITREKIPVTINNDLYLITIEIMPLLKMEEAFYLFVFQTQRIPAGSPTEKSGSPDKIKEEKSRARIKNLENELAQLRDDIRSVTEDQEVYNEELQSANEELLSSSEELQSLNEELETSKEELQASNEELQSLNQELIDRQDQLFAARNYAEAIVTTIYSPMVVLDAGMRIKSANASFYKFFNTTDTLTEGKSLFDINDGQWEIEELQTVLQKIIPEKTEFKDFEFTITVPSGGEKILWLSGRQLLTDKSSELLILLIMQDVTDSRMNARLRESEERFRLASELAGLGTWELNIERDRITNSAKIGEIMGICELECSREEFLQAVHPDDVKLAMDAFDKAVRQGSLFFEVRIIKDGNSTRWVRVNGTTLAASSKQPARLLGTVMDITEQKVHLIELEESEQRFKAIADSAPVLIWLTGLDKSFYFFNKGWLDFTGSTLEKESGTGWLDGVHPDDRPHVQRVIDEAFKVRKDFFLEFRLKRADGEFRWISIHGAPRFSPEKQFLGYIGGGIDITDQKNFASVLENQVEERTEELKKSHQTLQERNLQLERSNHELASFSYVASHDLQEPLRRIQAFSDRILEKDKDSLSETTKDYFMRMNKAAREMKQLVQDLLEYSQVNSTNKETEPTDLGQLVDSVIANLNNMLEEKAAVIEVASLPTLKIIPVQFTQLFSNLITNAVKYSKADTPPRIQIASELVSSEKIKLPEAGKGRQFWKITVTDNGIGFEQKYERQIFEMFQRLHAKKEYAGTGIGLAICKKIVQNYEGMITANSKPGFGSTFNIFLPVELQVN